MIHPCNFRYAGRLSNENARFLSALHEKFALSVTNALEVYLGASLKLKLVSLEQSALADYVASAAQSNYLLPCSIDVMNSACLVDVDIALVLPIIDLLLGGSGETTGWQHELTDIDENLMETVGSLIVQELERTWRALSLSLTPGHCIKPAMIQQVFPANEKLVLLMFEMTIGEITGPFTLLLPTPFVGYLLRHMKSSQSKKISSLKLKRPSLRERILDCDFTLSADVPRMGIKLRDLLEMKPGLVLRTATPVATTAQFTVEGTHIFDISPVRNGTLKAAQVLSRAQEPTVWKDQI
jgi:flagellar motor switch protein FliM